MQLEMARNRHRVRKADRIEPTEQTRKKLTEDPLFELLAGQDASLERAAHEIQAVYEAITHWSRLKRSAMFALDAGKVELSDDLAAAHAERYIPWTERQGPYKVDWTLRLVHDREAPEWWQKDAIRDALQDYARRMR